MHCPSCNTPNVENTLLCPGCGRAFASSAPSAARKDPGDDALMRAMLPVGRSWIAIAAGYAGLFACVVVPAPLALVLGLWAVYDLRKHPEKHGMGRAVFAIVMGVLGSAMLVYMMLAPSPY